VREDVLKRLVKTLVAAIVAGAALGGAAALGSTLFQPPPRDAAEFAARVEAGSTYWKDLDPPEAKRAGKTAARSWPGRPRAEVRFLRALDRVCAGEAAALAKLDAPRTRKQSEAYLSRWLRITGRYQDDTRALDPPKRLERTVARYLEVWDDAEASVREIRVSVRRRESFSVLLLMDRLDGLRAEADRLAGRLNVTSCVAEGFPETL
jgi:hypothetical protein